MDPLPMKINDSSFSNECPANTSPFHFPQIWHFPASGPSHSGLGLRRPQFGQGLTHFSDFDPTRDVPGNDPINSDHGGPIPNRKRRDSDEDSAKATSTSNGGGANANAMSDGGDGKRVKTTGNNRNESGKGEIETSSGKPAEQQQQQQQQTTPEPPKQDYIHVRARRGQATDSHSLAERARREKISERMKILQDVVPGCNKVIGKALVLDEIINYIQSLQRQVEFLSMKLEAVNSRLTPGIEVFPPKDHLFRHYLCHKHNFCKHKRCYYVKSHHVKKERDNTEGGSVFNPEKFDQQTFDTDGMPFTSQATREYSRGSSPEWLHMQVGGGFERTM